MLQDALFSAVIKQQNDFLFLQANISICMQDLFSAKAKGGSEYYMFIFVIYFVVPVIIISVCYTRVFYILYSDISSVEVQNEVKYPFQCTTIINDICSICVYL